MKFSAWYSAAQIVEQVPASPGVFQVRVADLVDYPTGRSAMIHYGAASELRAAMTDWAARQGPEDALYRHAENLGQREPADVLDTLVERFRKRFGRPPGP